MFEDFKKFIMRGNVVDLAVGIVIGAAFGKIVSSLVADIILPPLGMLMGNVDFSGLFINLSDASYPSLAAARQAGAPTINYGIFVNAVIDSLIVLVAVYVVVRVINKMKKKEEATPAKPSREEQLLIDIRDLLRERR